MTLKEELSIKVREHLSDRLDRKEIDSFIYNQDINDFRYIEILNCRLRHCEVHYACRNNGLLIWAVCPVKANSGNFEEICRFLNDLNWHSPGTVFEFNFANWTICVNQFFRLSNLNEFSTLLVSAFDWPVKALEKYGNDLARLLEN